MNTINIFDFIETNGGLPGKFTLIKLSKELINCNYPLTLDFSNVCLGIMDLHKIFKLYLYTHTK